jgi:hypothetical protein
MTTRFRITAGAIVTTAVLGTLLPAALPAYAQEAEFWDPIESVVPAKSPRKVIKAKSPRKAGMKRASVRKVTAPRTGIKKALKVARAKPKKPVSLADRLRSKARRMMLAVVSPKKSKMCRPREMDQLGLLDKLVPESGKKVALLPSGGTPFKFTPDTSIGPMSSLFGGTPRVFDSGRIGARSLPGGGGGGGGGSSTAVQSASTTTAPTAAAPTIAAPTSGRPAAGGGTTPSVPATDTPVSSVPVISKAPVVDAAPTVPVVITAPVVTDSKTSPAPVVTPTCGTNSGGSMTSSGGGSGSPSGTMPSGNCTTPVGGSTSGGGTAPVGGSTSGGGTTPVVGSTSGGSTTPVGGSTSGGGTTPVGGSSSGGGCGAGVGADGSGIPGGVLNPLPTSCGSSSSGGGSTSGGAQVPEPAALSLLGLGVLALGLRRKKLMAGEGNRCGQ